MTIRIRKSLKSGAEVLEFLDPNGNPTCMDIRMITGLHPMYVEGVHAPDKSVISTPHQAFLVGHKYSELAEALWPNIESVEDNY